MPHYLAKLFPFPSTADYIAFGIFVLILILLWSYLFRYFNTVKKAVKQSIATETTQGTKAISIIIAARNEKSNLRELIPLLLQQNYPKFEIVVADDGSWDETGAWLIPETELNPKLKYVFLDREFLKMNGKKFALTMGIKKAQYPYLLLIDADCRPASENWLSLMAGGFENSERQIVLGYSPFYKTKGFVNALARYENVQTGLMFLGMALKNKPYMGVGRNLAYSRAVYESAGGFASHAHIIAGDDDLFVQETATASNTAVCVHPDSFVWTEAKNNFADYWLQKKRHNHIGKYYTSISKWRLGLFALLQVLFWVCLIAYCFVASSFLYPLFVLLFRFILEWPVYHSCAKSLGSASGAGFYPFWTFFHCFFNVFNGISGYFTKKIKW